MTKRLIKTFSWLFATFLISCSDHPDKSSSELRTNNPSTIRTQNELSEIEYYSEGLHQFTFDKFQEEKCIDRPKSKYPDLSQLQHLPDDVLKSIKKNYPLDNPNFNCKFKVVNWGCGSPCQMVAIFDSETGKLITTLTASLGISYKLNSRLLIANPPLQIPIDTIYRKTIGEPTYWELRDRELKILN